MQCCRIYNAYRRQSAAIASSVMAEGQLSKWACKSGVGVFTSVIVQTAVRRMLLHRATHPRLGVVGQISKNRIRYRAHAYTV